MAEQFGTRVGDENGGFGVGDDAGNAPHVIFELRRACRRIERHRHATGVKRPIEGSEEFAPGGQHDGDAIAWMHITFEQAGRQRLRRGPQHPVGDVLAPFIVAIQRDMNPLAVPVDVPVKHLGEGGDGLRRMLDGGGGGEGKRRGWRDGVGPSR